MRNFIRNLHRAAALEAAKLTFAIIGVGSVLADFTTMRLALLLPASALLSATWFAIYRMMGE